MDTTDSETTSFTDICFTDTCRTLDKPYTALFGGSFDPFHLGHLEILKGLFTLPYPPAHVVLMPTFCNPLKNTSFFSPSLRLEMCEQIAHEMRQSGHSVEVSDFEVRQNRVVYSIESVEFLLGRGLLPLAFVLGEDSFQNLAQWREARRLCELVEFILIRREQEDKGQKDREQKDRGRKDKGREYKQAQIHTQEASVKPRILATLTLTHNPSTWASSHIKALLQANATNKALELIPPSLHRFCK